jgi:hypothetical protein
MKASAATAPATPATLATPVMGAAPVAGKKPAAAAVPFASLLQQLAGEAPTGLGAQAVPVPRGVMPFVGQESLFAGVAAPKLPKAPAAATSPNGAPAPALARGAALSGREDAVDPIHRHRAALAPPESLFFGPGAAAAPPMAPLEKATNSSVQTCARASLEELIPALVRRIAWSGDGRRGTVRIELGAGALAGATLLVQSDEGRVRVHLSAPAGADGEMWGRRIRERLAARNIHVEDVEVE